jgi:NAD(P)-dependent dehydrogenase (short-subunit alcohol dehydrogenase family)
MTVVGTPFEFAGQTLVVIGGSSGIGLETARRARERGAGVIITARNADRLSKAGLELGARIAAFDATNFERLKRFFDGLREPIDHVLVTAPGRGSAPLAEGDVEAARGVVDARLFLPLQVARNAARVLRPGGTLLFTGCTENSHGGANPALVSGLGAALPASTSALAREIAPIRVNLIVAGVVDAADIAALAVHLMSNAAVTGATFEIEGATFPAAAVAAR